MHRIGFTGLAAVVALVAASPVMAQGRGRGNDGVPPGQRPPAGMCRIWIDGVPPGRQPAPTDCATANFQRPANARVIYGDRPSPLHGRRIYSSNGNVVIMNGQRCIQRTESNGRVRTVCADGDGDRDDRLVARADRAQNRALDDDAHLKHHKKHKDKDHDDRDHDDRN